MAPLLAGCKKNQPAVGVRSGQRRLGPIAVNDWRVSKHAEDTDSSSQSPMLQFAKDRAKFERDPLWNGNFLGACRQHGEGGIKQTVIERQLVTSLRSSPIAGVVTNPRLPDNPIIAVNAAFTHLTGYTEHDVAGRNCRLLAGNGTEPWASCTLREAVGEGRAGFAELLNFRKDGRPFLNAVMIAPFRDQTGEIAFFFGSQIDVTLPGTAIARRHRAGKLLQGLTPRQLDVLKLMVAGLRNKQIAIRLSIDETTVKMHRAALLSNLSALTSSDAVRIAVEAGLTD